MHRNGRRRQKNFSTDVPVTTPAPGDRTDLPAPLHYWDHFDFTDTSLSLPSEITEQLFVDSSAILPYSSKAQTGPLLHRVCRALVSNEMIEHFVCP